MLISGEGPYGRGRAAMLAGADEWSCHLWSSCGPPGSPPTALPSRQTVQRGPLQSPLSTGHFFFTSI